MSPREHETLLRVRYCETDQMGVVHHANYLAYVEEGRTEMMAAAGCSYGEVEKSGIGLPVRRVEMRFRASAHYEDLIRVYTRVVGLRAASVRFGYRIVRAEDELLLVTAETELACVDLRAPERKVVLLPPDLREVLEPWAAG